jgi:hypothetical protein
MPYTIKAECPNCKKKAKGKDEVEALFGWRKMKQKKTLPQSYCRECRHKRVKKEKN